MLAKKLFIKNIFILMKLYVNTLLRGGRLDLETPPEQDIRQQAS